MLLLARLIRFYRQRTASIAVMALLLAQAIGLAHGIAHPQSRGGLPSAAVVASVVTSAATWADGLHDDGSVPCRVLDQLSHADALPASVCLPALPPAVQTAAAPLCTVHSARAETAYLARGPPLFLA
jgi:hypothetical protein